MRALFLAIFASVDCCSNFKFSLCIFNPFIILMEVPIQLSILIFFYLFLQFNTFSKHSLLSFLYPIHKYKRTNNIYIYIYTHTHTHTHIYIYIYIYETQFLPTAVVSILLYGCTSWTLSKRLEKKLDGNYTRRSRAILNKSWQQHPTRHQLYGHLPPITKTIQVRRNRQAGHCWRSRTSS